MCYSNAFLRIVYPNSALYYCIAGKILLPEPTLNFIQSTGVACSTYGGRGEVYTGFWLGKRPLGRPRRRWEGDIKMDPQEWDLGGGGGQ